MPKLFFEVHHQFERHQRIETDFAKRADPADVFLAGVQHVRQLGDDDVGHLAPRRVDAFALAASACRSMPADVALAESLARLTRSA